MPREKQHSGRGAFKKLFRRRSRNMEITPKLSVTEDKIRLLTVKTDMFKTACLTLNVLVPMGEYAAEYAVLSSYLVHSSKKYDSLIKLNSRLEELYGALLSGSISRHGENYRIQLSITCIDDSLTFDGKSVTARRWSCFCRFLQNRRRTKTDFHRSSCQRKYVLPQRTLRVKSTINVHMR